MKVMKLKSWFSALVLGFSMVIFYAGCGDDEAPAPVPACIDNDWDGYGEHCSMGADCDDSNANINPQAIETTCDGADNDCDAATLDAPDGDTDTWDVCGAGDPVNPDGKGPADCDDADPTAYPGATEVCDDDLQACGGTADAGCNGDGDNYCATTMTVVGSPAVCSSESGGAGTPGTDCNDSDATSYPGATEVCDDDLETCGGVADEGCDDDNDDWCDLSMTTIGTPTVCPNGGSDCDDGLASVYPGAGEVDNGVDNDCDGDAIELTLFDGDGDLYTDLYGSASDPTPDCNDDDATSYPGATEVCDDDLETCGEATDAGCNGDSDNYCTTSMNVVGSPAVCSGERGGVYPGTPGTDCNDGDISINPGAYDNCGDGIDQNCDGNTTCYAYLADYLIGLMIIDVSDPANSGPPVYRETSGYSSGVYVTGGYAYLADRLIGLTIIDVSDPANPGPPVYRATDWQSEGVYVTGGYAFLANGISGLAIIDVSDPINPGPPVYRDTSGNSSGVYVTGGYAFVADDESGLAIIDVSDPTNPGTPPVYRDTSGNSYGVYVTGGYAYVADGDSGLAIIDVSDPTNPGTPPVYRDISDASCGVYVFGGYAYVAYCGATEGLAIIDVSDPANPGTPVYRNTSGGHGVHVTGGYAYVAAGDGGLAIIDVSDPTNPGAPVYRDTLGESRGVYVTE